MQASLFSEMKEYTNKIPNKKHDEIWLFKKHLPKHIISFRIQIQIYSEKNQSILQDHKLFIRYRGVVLGCTISLLNFQMTARMFKGSSKFQKQTPLFRRVK